LSWRSIGQIYVPNFAQQFVSNAVPAATVWVGYSFGER